MSKWYRVGTKMPEDHEWVLVWHTGYATPKKARFHDDYGDGDFEMDGGSKILWVDDYWEVDGHNKNVGRITHWMPLPDPPEDAVTE